MHPWVVVKRQRRELLLRNVKATGVRATYDVDAGVTTVHISGERQQSGRGKYNPGVFFKPKETVAAENSRALICMAVKRGARQMARPTANRHCHGRRSVATVTCRTRRRTMHANLFSQVHMVSKEKKK